MGLFSSPHRLARHVTVGLPGPGAYAEAWRWFINSRVATFAALVLSIVALLGGLMLSSRFGL